MIESGTKNAKCCGNAKRPKDFQINDRIRNKSRSTTILASERRYPVIRSLEVQSVVSQSSATEKVTQTQHMNQDTLMRHFALQEAEKRAQKKTTVNASEESENIGLRDRGKKRNPKKKNSRHDNGNGKVEQKKNKPDTGEFIFKSLLKRKKR